MFHFVQINISIVFTSCSYSVRGEGILSQFLWKRTFNRRLRSGRGGGGENWGIEVEREGEDSVRYKSKFCFSIPNCIFLSSENDKHNSGLEQLCIFREFQIKWRKPKFKSIQSYFSSIQV